MRRLNRLAVIAALALLENPAQAYDVTGQFNADITLQRARDLVAQFGHHVRSDVHPAELDRRSLQRRRARQTHPGKRS